MLESGLTQLVYLARKAVNASEPLITKSSVGSAATTNSLDILGLITSLLVVLVLIVVSALILKKFNVVQPMPKGMKIIATLSVGLKEKVMVVEINHEQYILGVTANQINLLEKLTTPMTASSVPPADLSASLVNLFKKKS